MKLRSMVTFFFILFLGVLIGFTARDFIVKQEKKADKPKLILQREGQNKLINPLLSCDVASDVLSDPELGFIKGRIEKYLGEKEIEYPELKVSVYFRELNDGQWFSIGETEKFIPASLRKVPLMIAVLKQAEMQNNLLDRMVKVNLPTDYNDQQNIKPSKSVVLGNKYTIRDLIYRMIVYSDNNAFMFLTSYVNFIELKKVYTNLRIQNPLETTDDHYLSVQTYESFFRILYNSSYLNRESSDWALELMSQSEFKSGLVAGVPSTVTVAHKFGERIEEKTIQLHDCGIVYYPKHPYLLCVMSQGPSFEFLEASIADISREIYSDIDSQNQKKELLDK